MPSRKPRKIAVRSTDLGQSGWWILPPTAGIIAGGVSTVSSQLLTHNTASSAIAGVVSATVTGHQRRNTPVPRLVLSALPQAADR